MITIKTDPKVKAEVQKVARELGLPLSTMVNGFFRQVVREKRVVFEVGLTPNKKTAKRLMQIERDIAEGKNLSPIFNNTKEFDEYLDSL